MVLNTKSYLIVFIILVIIGGICYVSFEPQIKKATTGSFIKTIENQSPEPRSFLSKGSCGQYRLIAGEKSGPGQNDFGSSQLAYEHASLALNNGKTVLQEDISALANYPKYSPHTIFELVACSENNLVFVLTPYEGVSYQNAYALDITNLSEGFRSIPISVSRDYVGPDRSKIVGFDPDNRKKILLLSLNPLKISQLYIVPEDKTVFDWGGMGDDILDLWWQDNQTIGIHEYDGQSMNDYMQLKSSKPQSETKYIRTQ